MHTYLWNNASKIHKDLDLASQFVILHVKYTILLYSKCHKSITHAEL